MKSKTFELAVSRLLQDKAGKSELKVLIKWAENELEQWSNFKKVCEEKLKEK